MAEIVNLRRARKQRRRQEFEHQATAARSRSGESKSTRKERSLQSDQLARHLDRHRLIPGADEKKP